MASVVSLILNIVGILIAAFLFSFLFCAPLELRARVLSGKSSFLRPGALLYGITMLLVASFLIGFYERAVGIDLKAILGVSPEEVLGAFAMLVICLHLAYVWCWERPAVAPTTGAIVVTSAKTVRLAPVSFGMYLWLPLPWLLVLLASLGVAFAVYNVSPVAGVAVAFAAIGACLIGGGCRNRLDAALLVCWLLVIAFHALTAVAGAAPFARGYPFLWLVAGTIRWCEFFGDVVFAVCVSAVGQRVSTMILLGYLVYIARRVRQNSTSH